jgi:riboflavin biosynthesis pyrimidine reductase
VADLQPLIPSGAPLSARSLVECLRASARTDARRPFLTGVMIGSIDGRAAVQGRSVALGHPADRDLLRSLRADADAVLVGTGTMRAERYANLLDPDQSASREAEGRPRQPLIVTISRSFDVPWDVPLFAEPDARLLICTERADAEPPPGVAAAVEVATFAPGTLGPDAALARVGAEHGVERVLCEGGPRLLREVVAAGCLDALMLTVSPLLAAGDAPTVLAGPPLPDPARLHLAQVLRADDHLFLRYER